MVYRAKAVSERCQGPFEAVRDATKEKCVCDKLLYPLPSSTKMKKHLKRNLVSSLVLFFFLSSSGCSWIFMQNPPQDEFFLYRDTSPDCTDSVAAPVLDTIFGSLETVGALGLLGQGQTAVAVLSAGIATALLTSAYSGYSDASKCQSSIRDWTSRQNRKNQKPIQTFFPSYPSVSGCTKDTDCKKDRICRSQRCVDP